MMNMNKNNSILLILIVILLNFILSINAINTNYIVAIRRKKSDKKYDHESLEVQRKIDELVNDRMNDIYEIIEDNKETYILENGEMDRKLEELENEKVKFRKRSFNKTKLLFKENRRSNYVKVLNKRSFDISQLNNNSTEEYIPIESKLVSHICPVSNYYTVKVYLSEETKDIVCKLENVIFCEEDKLLDLNMAIQNQDKIKRSSSKPTSNTNSNIYYNINSIKNETNWSGVSVQSFPYSRNHLALLSQSAYTNMNKDFDNNFYYPSSAGKGIDMYFVDVGLNANHNDFNTSERTISCDAIVTEYGTYITSDEEKLNCSAKDENPSHGTMVSSVGAGSIFGVSKKANIHMIAIDLTGGSSLSAFDFILKNAKYPHKTVISVSLGSNSYSEAENNKLTDLIEAGFIMFVSAGNDNMNACASKDSGKFKAIAGFRKAIAVGAIDTNVYGNGYYRASYSNFGDCIDIFGPGTVTFANPFNGSRDDYRLSSGTSCSTPVVAGVAASIMSEHPEIKFNNEKMKKYIIEMSLKNVIHDLGSSDTPNRFVNNGKHSAYHKSDSIKIQCGKGYGKCTNGCCTKDGICLTYTHYPWEKCFVENGCQSEFGQCTTKNKVIEDCEKEYSDHKKCLIDISSDLDDSEYLKRCKIIESDECQGYFKKKVNNLSVCTIAKNYKSFKVIEEDYDEKKYHNNIKMCRKKVDKYVSQCETEMEENYHRYCFISDNIDFKDYKTLANRASFCDRINHPYCSSLYDKKNDGLKKYLPSCYYLLNNYNKNVIKDKTKIDVFRNNSYKSYANYKMFCDNVQETSVDICNDVLEDYKECHLNINNNNFDCTTFKSEKCQEFYNLLSKKGFVCNEAKKYASYDIINNFNSTIYDQYQEKCEMTILKTDAKRYWIYNASVNKCLFAPSKINQKPILKECDNSNESQWYLSSYPKGNIYSAANTNRCLQISDLNKGIMIVTKCENLIPFKYTDSSIFHSAKYGNGKCISIGDGSSKNTNTTVYYRKCNKTDDQIWSLSNRNPSELNNSKTKTQTVWLYNRKLNKCIHAGAGLNDKPYINGCWDTNAAKWEIPVSGDGYYKNVNNQLCLYVKDINKGELIMGKCNGFSIIKDINSSYNKESIISELDRNKCLDTDNPPDLNSFILVFNTCNKEHYQQHWEIRTSLPSTVVKCGKGVGECPLGQCCSKDGICGTMDEHCGTGCQLSYGKCFSTIPTTIKTNDKPKWIYNASADKCLYFQGSVISDKKVLLKNCEDGKRFKWYFSPYPKGYIHSFSETDYCLDVNSNRELKLKDCDTSSTFEYGNEELLHASVIGSGKCLTSGNGNDVINFNSCSKSNDQKWTVWDRNPYEIIKKKTRTIWIYNKKLDKCLLSGTSFTYRPVIGNCSNDSKAKWSIPKSGNGLFKSLYKGWCLNIPNIDNGTIVMRECNNNAIIKDIDTSYNKASIMSPLNSNKCLGYLNSSKVKLNMNQCDKSKKDQYWEIRTKNPASS